MSRVSHKYEVRVLHICVTWLIHMCIHMYDMTHSHVWHYSVLFVTSFIHASQRYDESCHTYARGSSASTSVMSHVWMGHVTRMNGSCHMYEWVMSHVWMCHVTYTPTHDSCDIYGWVVSHTWISHVTHMNESCLTYEWVMSHIWLSHVKHMNQSCHTYECIMSHVVKLRLRVTWHIQMSHVIYVAYMDYGVATMSRLLKIVGLFCKKAL